MSIFQPPYPRVRAKRGEIPAARGRECIRFRPKRVGHPGRITCDAEGLHDDCRDFR